MKNGQDKHNKSIGKRLFRLVLVVSIFLTMLFTSIQAWIDYNKKTKIVSKSIEQVELIQVEMIRTSIWSGDKEQLRALAAGILNFPYINYVAITNQENLVIDAGAKNDKGINKEITLTYDYNGKVIAIGSLLIQADTSKIFSEVLRNIIIIFFFQASTIFIAALMVFMLFERLVTRHLSAVAGHLKTYDINRSDAPLHLNKKIYNDEIDTLTEAFNSMIEKLSKTYREQLLTLKELHLSEERFRVIVEQAPEAILVYDFDLERFVDANKNAELLYGCPRENLLKLGPQHFYKSAQPDGLSVTESMRDHNKRVLDGENLLFERHIHNAKGQDVICEIRLSRLPSADRKLIRGSFIDITERKNAEHELKESRKQYRNLVEGTPDLITRVDTQGRFIFLNHSAFGIFGLPPEECIGRTVFDFIHPEDRKSTMNAFQSWLNKTDEIFTHENRLISIDGKVHHMTWSVLAEKDESGNVSGFASTTRDITTQRRAEEEKAKLEKQLIQSQKMESVGRLAGGVAHDFNNMLGVIIGRAEMALDQIEPNHPIHEDLTEIFNAAERSSDLTKQLLAFARKQTIAPKVLDLNDTVTGMLKMMQRLIGEDIHLTWQPAANLWQVKMDPSQIDQILANLCVNARDAISTNIGRITIETRNCKFDAEDCNHYADILPGDYIMLAVSDDGRGMDKQTLSQIFEPFFTTKGVGEGTGLGLSTVYGIVKQNEGFINVYSEPGHGTTFKIYLPRYLSKTESLSNQNEKMPVIGGNETILLVEDEPTFLRLTTKMLERHGYTVLTANRPNEAIILAQEHSGEINLLITDVIMPEMNGRDLAARILILHPHLKYLFMSGYTDDAIAHHGVLDEGVHFIQKPFTIQTLASKTREVLDR